ncbi:MAG: hypothetical protein B7733_14930 [Myxococcales bacterium FL481]|nr:MAG: hypothetical protein B7733_14930 [Myxococcales bacterium FL481]
MNAWIVMLAVAAVLVGAFLGTRLRERADQASEGSIVASWRRRSRQLSWVVMRRLWSKRRRD